MTKRNFVLSAESDSDPYAQLPITTEIEKLLNDPIMPVRRVPGGFQYGHCHTHILVLMAPQSTAVLKLKVCYLLFHTTPFFGRTRTRDVGPPRTPKRRRSGTTGRPKEKLNATSPKSSGTRTRATRRERVNRAPDARRPGKFNARRHQIESWWSR